MGFEVVVRPAILPNIRPAPAQSLPPLDDPDKGFAVIRGNGSKQIDLSTSFSGSTSQNKRKETQRRVDEVRVFQQEDDGTVNKDNYVDVDVVNKLWTKGPGQPSPGFNGDDVAPTVPGKGYTGDDLVPKGDPNKVVDNIEVKTYRKVQEADNIEIKKKNVIKKSGI